MSDSMPLPLRSTLSWPAMRQLDVSNCRLTSLPTAALSLPIPLISFAGNAIPFSLAQCPAVCRAAYVDASRNPWTGALFSEVSTCFLGNGSLVQTLKLDRWDQRVVELDC
jgi:hypothetical protein